MLAETYVRLEGAMPVIGVGGIDSGETAVAKIRAGATLIQLYSALVFQGLGLLPQIKRGLLDALKQGRHQSLADLTGMDAADITAQDWPV
jgi:dihydroorotate dehydrogenase